MSLRIRTDNAAMTSEWRDTTETADSACQLAWGWVICDHRLSSQASFHESRVGIVFAAVTACSYESHDETFPVLVLFGLMGAPIQVSSSRLCSRRRRLAVNKQSMCRAWCSSWSVVSPATTVSEPSLRYRCKSITENIERDDPLTTGRGATSQRVVGGCATSSVYVVTHCRQVWEPFRHTVQSTCSGLHCRFYFPTLPW